jgi:hypothetical protein
LRSPFETIFASTRAVEVRCARGTPRLRDRRHPSHGHVRRQLRPLPVSRRRSPASTTLAHMPAGKQPAKRRLCEIDGDLTRRTNADRTSPRCLAHRPFLARFIRSSPSSSRTALATTAKSGQIKTSVRESSADDHTDCEDAHAMTPMIMLVGAIPDHPAESGGWRRARAPFGGRSTGPPRLGRRPDLVEGGDHLNSRSRQYWPRGAAAPRKTRSWFRRVLKVGRSRFWLSEHRRPSRRRRALAALQVHDYAHALNRDILVPVRPVFLRASHQPRRRKASRPAARGWWSESSLTALIGVATKRCGLCDKSATLARGKLWFYDGLH